MAPYFRFNIPCAITSTTTTSTTIQQYSINLYARQIAPTVDMDFHYSTDGGSTWNFVGTSVSTTCSNVATLTVASGSSVSVRMGSPSNLAVIYSSTRTTNSTTCPAWTAPGTCEWPIATNANRDYAFTANSEETAAC